MLSDHLCAQELERLLPSFIEEGQSNGLPPELEFGVDV